MTIYFVAWQYAQLHLYLFLTTPDCNAYIFYGHVPGGLAECAHQNSFNHTTC
jgi:hypothetical protein